MRSVVGRQALDGPQALRWYSHDLELNEFVDPLGTYHRRHRHRTTNSVLDDEAVERAVQNPPQTVFVWILIDIIE